MQVRTLPKAAEKVLSPREKLFLAFSMNRKPIGFVLTGLVLVFRFGLHFEGHTEVADWLKEAADWLLIGTVATAVAGTTQPDSYHQERAEAKIRQRSGQWPVHQRRRDDFKR